MNAMPCSQTQGYVYWLYAFSCCRTSGQLACLFASCFLCQPPHPTIIIKPHVMRSPALPKIEALGITSLTPSSRLTPHSYSNEIMDFSSSSKAASCLVKRLQQAGASSSSSSPSSSLLLPAAQLLSSTLMAKPSFLPEDIEAPVQTLLLAASDEAARWDCLCVGLLVCNDAVARMAPAPAVSPALLETLYTIIARHLEHDEPRVRGLVAKTLGLLCTLPAVGTDAYVRFQAQLWGSVDSQFTKRATETRPTNLGAQKDIPLDDVTGWRALETSLLALQAVVEGCGPELVRQGLLSPTEWLDKAVYAAAAHPNRYVREAAMNMVRVLVERCCCDGDNNKEVLPLRALAAVVAEGLADAWPQVVYAAARATRSLLTASGGQGGKEELFGVLLPPLCQSRYYVPEGVQVHAQETWVGLFAAAGAAAGEQTGSGRETVARYVGEMVEHHCHAVGHGKSHFARVAACYALKELAAKVEGKAVAPFAERMVVTVVPCLEDPHWEVRSAGCVALAQLVESFPGVVGGREEGVLEVCFARLEDESWSIREEAAWVLAALARFGGGGEEKKEEMQGRLVARLGATLEAARGQPVQTKEEQLNHFNDPQAHTGRPIFGCCGGGMGPQAAQAQAGHAHDHAHTHTTSYSYEAQPWEVSEGALYLFRELCAEDLRPETEDGFVETFLPILAELGRLQHFEDADRLRQSLWRILPEAMQKLGKPVLKRNLELFTPALLGALASSSLVSPLTRHCAVTCLEELSRQMGPSIFLGRLSEEERGVYFRNASSSSSSSSSLVFPPPVGVGAVAGEVGSAATMRQSRPSIVSM